MSAVVEKLVARIKECQKENLSNEMKILKTVYGEIELIRSRSTKKFTDEDAIKVFKKFKVGVEECIASCIGHAVEPSQQMHDEIKIYDQYIPVTMSLFEIIEFLNATSKQAITDARSDGQAIGIGIGACKKDGLPVDGKDVKLAVESMRAD
jgi:hypothetical protein